MYPERLVMNMKSKHDFVAGLFNTLPLFFKLQSKIESTEIVFLEELVHRASRFSQNSQQNEKPEV